MPTSSSCVVCCILALVTIDGAKYSSTILDPEMCLNQPRDLIFQDLEQRLRSVWDCMTRTLSASAWDCFSSRVRAHNHLCDVNQRIYYASEDLDVEGLHEAFLEIVFLHLVQNIMQDSNFSCRERFG